VAPTQALFYIRANARTDTSTHTLFVNHSLLLPPVTAEVLYSIVRAIIPASHHCISYSLPSSSPSLTRFRPLFPRSFPPSILLRPIRISPVLPFSPCLSSPSLPHTPCLLLSSLTPPLLPLSPQMAVSFCLCRLLSLDHSLAPTVSCLLSAPLGGKVTVLSVLRLGCDPSSASVRESLRGVPGETVTATDYELLVRCDAVRTLCSVMCVVTLNNLVLFSPLLTSSPLLSSSLLSSHSLLL
jgi:hypothetical protein